MVFGMIRPVMLRLNKNQLKDLRLVYVILAILSVIGAVLLRVAYHIDRSKGGYITDYGARSAIKVLCAIAATNTFLIFMTYKLERRNSK